MLRCDLKETIICMKTLQLTCFASLLADEILEISHIIVDEKEECALEKVPVENKIFQEEPETKDLNYYLNEIHKNI